MLLRTPADLGSAIRDRRRQLKLDQIDLAKKAGVSRKWIVDVEKGKRRAEIGLLLRTLDALGLRLSLENGEAVPNEGYVIPVADIDEVLKRARSTSP
jgi:HTH-type transcriptional regulator / antitoxin HipB